MRAVVVLVAVCALAGCGKKKSGDEADSETHSVSPRESARQTDPLDESAIRAIRDGKGSPDDLKYKTISLVGRVANVTGGLATIEFGEWTKNNPPFFVTQEVGATIPTTAGTKRGQFVRVTGFVTKIETANLPVAAHSVDARHATSLTLTLTDTRISTDGADPRQ